MRKVYRGSDLEAHSTEAVWYCMKAFQYTGYSEYKAEKIPETVLANFWESYFKFAD